MAEENETAVPTPQRRDGGFGIRNPTDFAIVAIYLPSLQTRSDGGSGFYYYAADRDNGLKFVPALQYLKPYAHYLRERLPFYEGDLAKKKSEVETIRKKLDDPDFDDIVQRQSLTNKTIRIKRKKFKDQNKTSQR